ncbi:MAG TPA: sigma-70 family RNA polymerase sigma factor [Terriglobia bacterium]|nr:sigma-70 family RNA polymerase sigma factor [Terriglobia bacterium]
MESGHDPEEVDWIRRAQTGDQEAFALLVQRYQRKVFSLVYHLVRRQEDVEDVAQEIFLKVFRAIRSYNFRASFAAWIGRVAVNHCYDYLRRVRASRVSYFWELPEEGRRVLEASPEAGEKGTPTIEEQTALKEIVQKLLDRAPAEDRTVVVLKDVEDLSVEEIAATMNWTVSKVKVRLHRARKRMLADLKRWR